MTSLSNDKKNSITDFFHRSYRSCSNISTTDFITQHCNDDKELLQHVH